MTANVPIPDELNAVRLEIKRLAERESELRRLILTDPETRTGNDWVAEVKEVTQDRCDLKELKACHPDIAAQFTFPQTITRIVLNGINEDGELVSARKMRAAKSGDAQ